ncbi:hypothetical protein OZ411_31375 [Bradyrhizobium sp. Arg237L]|uniref:hypothetical protein n=1 Tax=Bradyrhizobium sp. Arg237L TaxID=3003352 RepID=UPI00249F203E|nr:hypothetical protein [Bradyrhizobium sp. Arg237L]MDI4237316.1 hypothetical protein [Bradyrhizobium sp. Arg237L]
MTPPLMANRSAAPPNARTAIAINVAARVGGLWFLSALLSLRATNCYPLQAKGEFQQIL